MSSRPRFGLGLVGVLVLSSVTLLASPASGAARLLESTPADGSSLSGLRDVSFQFDSLLIADGADVTVTRLDGTSYQVGSISVEGDSLRAMVAEDLPSGNYEVGYSVVSSDGALNTGAVRVSIDAASQALSGGLLAVIGIFGGLCVYLAIVFRADKRRRPKR